LGLCLLFLRVAANNLAASTVKEDEIFSISGSLSTQQSFFINFFALYVFFSLQSTLSFFRIQLYNFLFLGVNSESEAKLSSFNRECLALGFEEELQHLMCLSSPSEALTSTELRVMEVSSAAKVLADAGDTWSAGICENGEGLSAWTEVGVRGREASDLLE
jgi:hypothetical protein